MDPIVDFSTAEDLELPEGVTAEFLNSPAVQGLIGTTFDTIYDQRYEKQAGGLKNNNEKLLAEKKTLQEALTEYKDIDLDEVKRLRELEKNNGDATKQINELTAANEKLLADHAKEIEERDGNYSKLENVYHAEQLNTFTTAGISEFNAKFPDVGLEEGADRWIRDEAQKTWRRQDDGSYVAMGPGEIPIHGSDRLPIKMSDWINKLRDQPAFTPLFKKPSGGGAGEGAKIGQGGTYNQADIGGDENQRAAAFAAKHGLAVK